MVADDALVRFLALLGDRFSYSYFLFIDGPKTGLKLLHGQVEASLLCLLSRETLISKPIPN